MRVEHGSFVTLFALLIGSGLRSSLRQQFYDRCEVAEKLYRRLAGGSSNVVMYAPRRYGKTSLVKKVLARFRDEKTPTVYVDLMRLADRQLSIQRCG